MSIPLSYEDDSNVENVFELDALTCEFGHDAGREPLVLPGEAGNLIREINQRQCEHAEVVELVTGEWFLRWEERHPELPSAYEYSGVTFRSFEEFLASFDRYRAKANLAKRLEYRKLYDVMPSKRYEKPLTEDQAVTLRDTVWEVDGPNWVG
jgi:hypothetical protein